LLRESELLLQGRSGSLHQQRRLVLLQELRALFALVATARDTGQGRALTTGRPPFDRRFRFLKAVGDTIFSLSLFTLIKRSLAQRFSTGEMEIGSGKWK